MADADSCPARHATARHAAELRWDPASLARKECGRVGAAGTCTHWADGQLPDGATGRRACGALLRAEVCVLG